MSVFKFLEVQHANQLVEHGILRVTTLHICRSTEAGVGRRDGAEGMYQHDIPFMRWVDVNPNDPQNPEYLKLQAEGFRPAILGGHLALVLHAGLWKFEIEPNQYVYCVSRRQTQEMENRMKTGDDYWVEIFEPEKFFAALDSEMIRRECNVLGVANVEYRSRKFHRNESIEGVNGALIKDPSFQHEWEARARWMPKIAPPIWLPLDDIKLPELTKYCRLDRRIV